MSFSLFTEAMRLPAETRVERRVPKSMLAEQGASTAADRRALQDGIEELFWVAALKPGNIGVPTFRDDTREYLEVAVLTGVLRRKARPEVIARLIHRAVPYPVVLWLDAEEVVLLSVAHKRRSLAGGQSVVLDDLVDAGGFRRSALDTHEAAFLASLDVAGLPRGDLHALYQGLHDRITALEVARVAGVSTPVITAERAAAQREVLAVWAQRKKEIAGLRAQAEREAQISRRVELNVTIQRLEAEVAASMRALQERSP